MYEDYGCVRPVMGCDQDAVEVTERAARRGASALTLTLMSEAFAATRTMLLYLLNLKTAVTLSTS